MTGGVVVGISRPKDCRVGGVSSGMTSIARRALATSMDEILLLLVSETLFAVRLR